MPTNVLYFSEYKGIDIHGIENHPYITDKGQWCLSGIIYSIESIGRICNIPEDELIILKLTYG